MAMNVKYNNLSKFKNSGTTATSQKKQLSDAIGVFCDYCQNSGHIRDKCFCLHGYPDWHRLHGKPKPKPKKLSSTGSVTKSAAQVSAISSASASNSHSQMDTSVKDSMVF